MWGILPSITEMWKTFPSTFSMLKAPDPLFLSAFFPFLQFKAMEKQHQCQNAMKDWQQLVMEQSELCSSTCSAMVHKWERRHPEMPCWCSLRTGSSRFPPDSVLDNYQHFRGGDMWNGCALPSVWLGIFNGVEITQFLSCWSFPTTLQLLMVLLKFLSPTKAHLVQVILKAWINQIGPQPAQDIGGTWDV